MRGWRLVACSAHVPCIWWTHKQWEENAPGTARSNMSYHEGKLASLSPLNALEVARWELPPYKTVWTMSIFYNTSTIWPTWTGCSNLLELLRMQTYTGQEGPLLGVWKQYSPCLDNFPISMTRGNCPYQANWCHLLAKLLFLLLLTSLFLKRVTFSCLPMVGTWTSSFRYS